MKTPPPTTLNPEPPIPNPAAAKAYAAWAFVCVIWGTTYLAIRVCLETIPPLLMGGIRFIIAGGAMIAWLALRGEALPSPRAWPSLALLGVLMLACGNGGVVWAEQTVPSGLTAVLVATSPFWMVGIDAIVPPRTPLTSRRLLGLAVGFCGIVMLVWPEVSWGSGRGFLVGVAAAQFSCVGWALGSAYSRRRGRGRARDESVLAISALQMLFGGLCLTAIGLLDHEAPRLSFNLRTTLALGHLIVFGAIGGFTAFAYALKHLPIATVSLYAYINPVIAVVLGTLILKEPFSARMMLAAGIVFFGVVLVRGNGRRWMADG